MRHAHPSIRRRSFRAALRTLLLALLCGVSVLLQSVAAPLHAAAHLESHTHHAHHPAHAHAGQGHDEAPQAPADASCDLCQLISQTGDGQTLTPPEAVGLLPLQGFIRAPRPRPIPTRLVLADDAPRAPPAVA